MVQSEVLIIDDDIDDIEILVDAFTQTGIKNVHFVHSAMEAFVYLRQWDTKAELPKLIVTDLQLPGMTGIEFLKDLKQIELYKHIDVLVLLTTNADKEMKKYAQMSEFDYLEKPSSFDEYLTVAALFKLKIETFD